MTVVALPSLSIRRLDAASLEEAAGFLHKVWHQTYRDQLPSGLRAQRTQAYFATYLEARASQCWTARMGRRFAGLATVSSNCLEDLWVARRYRRRGIASRLTGAAMSHLAERGFDFAQAGCESFNADAVAFFRAAGWREIGSESLQLVPGRPIDALVFSRPLDRHPGAAAGG
jgi:ribosomal protein S18 acetylase RimI-like enzyme